LISDVINLPGCDNLVKDWNRSNAELILRFDRDATGGDANRELAFSVMAPPRVEKLHSFLIIVQTCRVST
jgi:hypothetical protein